MKVLLINKFLYPKGGDAISTLTTGALLDEKGHDVFYWGMESPENPEFPFKEYFVSHVDYNRPLSLFQKIRLSLNILYSLEARDKIENLFEKVRPDIVHLNNFAHQLSPSILDVIRKYHLPVVMTIRDYKLVCPSYSMLMDGKPCERCKDGRYHWCFLKKCTKDSYMKSLLNTVEMYLHHKILHIYDQIDLFIAPSKFLEEEVKKMGFTREIIYLSNFVDVKDYKPQYHFNENAVCYFGRLSEEKGIFTLIEAMRGLGTTLKIMGDGPLKESLELKVKGEKLNQIHFLGYKTGDELKEEIRNCMFAILPSESYENNPRSVMEAFALGKPVIGSRIGGIPELVREGETGLTFEPGNAGDLREKMSCLMAAPDKITEMGKNARMLVEEHFNPDSYYEKLMKIYSMAIAKNK
jgi:glycosyltransferase involved in cell wall biosynthesis